MLTRGGLALLGVANAIRISSGFLLAAGFTAASRCGLLRLEKARVIYMC